MFSPAARRAAARRAPRSREALIPGSEGREKGGNGVRVAAKDGHAEVHEDAWTGGRVRVEEGEKEEAG